MSGPLIAVVSTDRLEHHPNNVRRDLGDLRELTESIRERGVQTPPRVEHRTGRPMLRVVCGNRRLAAARIAGRARVPAVIVPEGSVPDAMLDMLTENGHRLNVSREDRAAAIRKLRERYGLTVTEIARRLGVSEATVYTWQVLPPVHGGNPQSDSGQDPGLPGPCGWAPPAPRPKRPRAPRIRPTLVHELHERWVERTADLVPDEAAQLIPELLEDLQGLLGAWRPTGKAPRVSAPGS